MKKLAHSSTSLTRAIHYTSNILPASSDHKYFIDISVQRLQQLSATYTLNIFCHANILKRTFFTLVLFFVTLTSMEAGFKSLPEMQEFECVTSDDDAVNQLFYGQNYEISEMKKTSAQAQKTYAVITPKNKYFVKITREDCCGCSDTSFGYEWQLKDDEQKNNLIKTIPDIWK